MDLGRSGSYAISNRQRSAPARRRDRTLEGCKQWLSVPIRDGKNGHLGDGLGIFTLEPLGFFVCAHSRGKRIPRVERSVQYTAALHALGRTHRSLRKGQLLGVAVIGGIGINNAANGAVLCRYLRLDASPRFSVAGNHDGSFDRDTVARELLI